MIVNDFTWEPDNDEWESTVESTGAEWSEYRAPTVEATRRETKIDRLALVYLRVLNPSRCYLSDTAGMPSRASPGRRSGRPMWEADPSEGFLDG